MVLTGGGATGIKWVELWDATAPTTMNYLGQNVRHAEMEKPWLQVWPASVEQLCHLQALSLLG